MKWGQIKPGTMNARRARQTILGQSCLDAQLHSITPFQPGTRAFLIFDMKVILNQQFKLF